MSIWLPLELDAKTPLSHSKCYLGIITLEMKKYILSISGDNWFVNFAALSGPFLAVIFYEFLINGKTYIDNTSADRIFYMVSTSLAWEFSNWPPFLARVEYGFFEGWRPSIPEMQLTALYGYLSGWPRENLSGFANFGLVVMLGVIVIASAWGASINRSIKIPPRLILTAAVLIAVQPFMMTYFWSSYYHYTVLLLPSGLAIIGLAKGFGATSKPIRAVFIVFGYLLSMQYFTLFLISALFLTFFLLLKNINTIEIYDEFSNLRTSSLIKIQILVLFFLFIFGFVLTYSDLLSQLAFIKNNYANSNIYLFISIFLISAITIAFYFWKNLVHYLDLSFLNVFYVTAGHAIIGWAIGTNLLIFGAWQRGMINTLKSGEAYHSASIVEKFEFLYQTNPWHWVWSLLALGALVFVLKSFRGDVKNQFEFLFLGLFVLILMALNLVSTPVIDHSIYPIYSVNHSYGFSDGRRMASVSIAIPIVLYMCWKFNSTSEKIAIGIVLIISLLSLRDYHQNLRPTGIATTRIQTNATELISRYLGKNKSSRLICFSLIFLKECESQAVFFAYQKFHDSNNKNTPLPVQIGHRNHRFINPHSSKCTTIETIENCLRLSTMPSYPILVVGLKDGIPPHLMTVLSPVRTNGKYVGPLAFYELK